MSGKRTSVVVSAVAALIVAVAGAASASTFIQMDVAALARDSSAVVQARVVAADSAWNDDRTMIFTQVTLAVTRVLRGEAGEKVVLRVPGGTVDDFTAEMEGAPRFTVDEEVVVFLGQWPDGVPMVVGYAQGLSQVVRDKAGNSTLHGGAADGMAVAAIAKQLAR